MGMDIQPQTKHSRTYVSTILSNCVFLILFSTSNNHPDDREGAICFIRTSELSF